MRVSEIKINLHFKVLILIIEEFNLIQTDKYPCLSFCFLFLVFIVCFGFGHFRFERFIRFVIVVWILLLSFLF